MFSPVGSQPPSVYWRRRLLLVASLVLLVALVVLTLRVALSDDPSKPAAAGSTRSSSSSQPAPTASSSSQPASSSSSSSKAPASSSASSAATSAAPKACVVSALTLAASAGKPNYAVGAEPVLSILVTNPSATPCVQDLADKQIVLRVYNGESRVWGSHDCKTEPGTDLRTLMGKATVRVSIVWTGLSSQPNNCTNRQRVGAGTYTVYASLAGRVGTAAQFTVG